MAAAELMQAADMLLCGYSVCEARDNIGITYSCIVHE
jgi:hypothetical protein